MPDLIEQLAIRLSWQITPAESLVMIRHPAVDLTGFRPDETISHSTKLPKDNNQVVGYSPE
jgi:hypothetical protein